MKVVINSKFPKLLKSKCLSLSIIAIALLNSGCVKPPPDLVTINTMKAGDALIAFHATSRIITLETDGKNKRLISIEKDDRGIGSVVPLGTIHTTQPSGLRVVNLKADNQQAIKTAWLGGQQELRFDDIPMEIEKGKINYIGEVVFDMVNVRRIYSSIQTSRFFYLRISFADNFESANEELTKYYGDQMVDVVHKPIQAKPMLFDNGSRFYSRKKIGWLEGMDALIK